jgi:hypothetical protein
VPFLSACCCTTAVGRAQGFTWSDYRALTIIASHRQLTRCWWCWDNLNIHLAFPGRKVGDVAASAGGEARPPQGDRPDEDGNEGQVPGPAPRPGQRRRSSVTCTVGDALDDWLAAGLGGRSDLTGGALQGHRQDVRERLDEVELREQSHNKNRRACESCRCFVTLL